MMRVDAWTHFIPKPFSDRMSQIAGNFADIGKRMREIPCIHDLDERRRVVDQFPHARDEKHRMRKRGVNLERRLVRPARMDEK